LYSSHLTPGQQSCYQAVKKLGGHRHKEACTCVSGWCEGNLCTLPNPVQEQITDSGVTHYTSGGVVGSRKSGDTEGYSVRGAWSVTTGRTVFVVDTCGGCGERGTSGSAAQRAALLLLDGPPKHLLEDDKTTCKDPTTNDEAATTALVQQQVPEYLLFVGKAESHVFSAITYVEVQVHTKREEDEDDGSIITTTTISVASSDGAGCSTNQTRPIITDNRFVGWEYDTSILYGCGYGGDDPLAMTPQKRSLRFVSSSSSSKTRDNDNDNNGASRIWKSMASDSGAILQEMGQDIYLTLKKMDLRFAMKATKTITKTTNNKEREDDRGRGT
jgi:hypothetical protein